MSTNFAAAGRADPALALPRCPVCHSPETVPLCEVDGYAVFRCRESATDFVWPMPDARQLKELYDREAWFEGGERGGYENYDVQTEPSLALVTGILDRFPAPGRPLAVLDIGCGYGSHLSLAAERGWRCFGVEPSAHARKVAMQRHGGRMAISERVEHLLPQRYDLILMLEVIEHLRDPYALFFSLFGRDAIGPETLVVITTPNARSRDAVASPALWAYRHPPSHLVFYSAKSLEILLRRLLFKDVGVRGIADLPAAPDARFNDEGPSVNEGLEGYLGVAAEGRGCEFKEFMHERYVPGAYWKLTEYEHLPRYNMAASLAAGGRALDFGCGTGYGSATLAAAASSVVGLDISQEAIDWARQTHRYPNLVFERRSDLGAGLAAASFDLVTCFEMIEHVDHETQQATVRNIARLLADRGKLIISTPDPRFTADYGENPYHLREMTEAEFAELLRESFGHVTIFRQWVRPNILIGPNAVPDPNCIEMNSLWPNQAEDIAVGFVAICSNQAFELPPAFCQFDISSDFNRRTLDTENRINWLKNEELALSSQLAEARKWNLSLQEGNAWLEEQRQALTAQVQTLEARIYSMESELSRLADMLTACDQMLQNASARLQRMEATIAWKVYRSVRLFWARLKG